MGGLMVVANFAVIAFIISTCTIAGIHHMIHCKISWLFASRVTKQYILEARYKQNTVLWHI
jgi:hypothetical protein